MFGQSFDDLDWCVATAASFYDTFVEAAIDDILHHSTHISNAELHPLALVFCHDK